MNHLIHMGAAEEVQLVLDESPGHSVKWHQWLALGGLLRAKDVGHLVHRIRLVSLLKCEHGFDGQRNVFGSEGFQVMVFSYAFECVVRH